MVRNVILVVVSVVVVAMMTLGQSIQTQQPAIPVWTKYSLVKIANGVNGCASANGCWQVNGVLGAAAAAGLTQDVALATLPAKWHISDWVVKSVTACAGPATASTGLGVTANTTLYRAATYDIEAAVSDTNISSGPTAGAGTITAASTGLVASLVTTGSNVDQLAAGCAVDYKILMGVRP
jgi:hypothetical protein